MKMFPSCAVATAAIVLAFHPAQAADEPLADAAEQDGPTAASIMVEAFSLPITEADRLLLDIPSDALRYKRLREMLAGGKARLERLIVLRTKSGQRAVYESIDELRYATEFRKPRPPQVNPPDTADTADKSAPKTPTSSADEADDGAIPTAFETRNVGDTLEIEPVIGPDGMTIDLNLALQIVRHVGDRTGGGPFPVKTPLFETSKVTTSVSVHGGQPYFLGTLSPPFGNGLAQEQKEQRVWLAFFTVDLVRLEPLNARLKGAAGMVARAQAMRIPKLEFRDASVAEAVEFLRRKSVELDREKKGLNIVLKAPPNLAKTKITLTLKDVPLMEALRYVANLATLIVEPEDSALLLRPAGESP